MAGTGVDRPGSASVKGGSPGTGDARPDLASGLNADIAGRQGGGPERGVGFYIGLALFLVLGSVLLPEFNVRTPRIFHPFVGSLSALLALIIGALSLVRFYSRKTSTFLFIGSGFLGTALLDAYHAYLSSPLFVAREGVVLDDLNAWSYTASSLFLSIFLIASWSEWRRERDVAGEASVNETSVFMTSALLTAVIFAFFAVMDLAPAVYPDWIVTRPGELVPGAFFGVALAGYLRKGVWRSDPAEHWLVIALIVMTVSHFGFAARSISPHDLYAVAGIMLRTAGYIAVLAGLMTSVYLTFRREETVLDRVRQVNEALADEVAVRREAERVVAESEERLRDFLDNAHDLIITLRPDGEVLYVNQAWSEALGRSAESMTGESIFTMVHAGSHDRLRHALQQVQSRGSLDGIEVNFEGDDGTIVSATGGATASRRPNEPVQVRAIFRDMTDRKKAERRLAISEANLTALVENTGDTIWSVDARHRLITFNSAFALQVESITGKEPRVGQAFSELVSDAEQAWFAEVYDKALGGLRFSRDRSEIVDGQVRHFELFFNPIQSGLGITGVAVFGQDVTRAREAEEELRETKEMAVAANQAKSQFLANMSHELRTPLNSVIGFANILLKKGKDRLDPKEIGFLERILANGKHLLQLINEVLDLAKIEAGRMDVDREPVDLVEFVPQLIMQIEGPANEKGLALRADVPEGVQPWETDPRKLKQILINLVGNAVKFTEKGEVVVRVEIDPESGQPTSIAVSDTGIGIPQDRLDAIFEAFQQAEAGTSRRYGGTGLGLAISRSMCHLLGCDLEVESEPGEGSTFRVTIGTVDPTPVAGAEEGAGEESDGTDGAAAQAGVAPAVSPGETEEDRRQAARVEQVRFRVLVVDDDEDARTLLHEQFADLGCEVTLASSGYEGLDRARELRPDLVTLDLMMPGMSGWETLRAFKADAELRDIPAVVVSVVPEKGRARMLGAVDMLTKPVGREDLLRVLWRNLVREQGGHVLVVDDDAEVRAFMTNQLEGEGLTVRTATNGREALHRVREEAPDVILLDLMMPVMDGTTFLSTLRETPEWASLPVVVLTGKELTQDERAELAAHAAQVIPKGVTAPGTLRIALGALLGDGVEEEESVSEEHDPVAVATPAEGE